jgi:hypothetical protein
MFAIHTDAHGNEIAVRDMTDDHLFNFVLLVLNRCAQRLRSLRLAVDKETVGGAYFYALHEREKPDAKTVARKNRADVERLTPYLAELFLRAVENSRTDEVRALLTAVTMRNRAAELPAQVEDESPF